MDDENEPALYRYKEECEKACLISSNSTDTMIKDENVVEKSLATSLDSKITDNDAATDTVTDISIGTSEQITTTLESFSEDTPTASSQRPEFTVTTNTPHKLLTGM